VCRVSSIRFPRNNGLRPAGDNPPSVPLEQRPHVPRGVENPDDLQRIGLGPINDQVGVHLPEAERFIRQVRAQMAQPRVSGQAAYRVAKGRRFCALDGVGPPEQLSAGWKRRSSILRMKRPDLCRPSVSEANDLTGPVPV